MTLVWMLFAVANGALFLYTREQNFLIFFSLFATLTYLEDRLNNLVLTIAEEGDEGDTE